MQHSPDVAEAAGLRVNDIILNIGSQTIDAVPAMLGVAFEHPPAIACRGKFFAAISKLRWT